MIVGFDLVLSIPKPRASIRTPLFGGGKPCQVRNRSINQNFPLQSCDWRVRSCGEERPLRLKPSGHAWPCFWPRILAYQIQKPPDFWASTRTRFAIGESDGHGKGFPFTINQDQGVPWFFPPRIHVIVKSLACEIPARRQEPLSRLFVPDIQRIIIAENHVENISRATIWRILDADAIKPWRRRSWIWSRDPLFFERAAPVLDLYLGIWKGRHLRADEYVLSADEKTSIQARIRIHPTQVVADGRGQRVEHEYVRGGAWTYLAALDVHRAKVFGRTEESNGIVPFGKLIDQVMRQEPYASARRVFWIVDQGSSHRPNTFPQRLKEQFRNAEAVSLPVHASWLNQVEIYFSILERKALTPNDFTGMKAVAQRIRGFEKLFMRTAKPFNWRFSRDDLRDLVARMPHVFHDRHDGGPKRNSRQLGQTG